MLAINQKKKKKKKCDFFLNLFRPYDVIIKLRKTFQECQISEKINVLRTLNGLSN